MDSLPSNALIDKYRIRVRSCWTPPSLTQATFDVRSRKHTMVTRQTTLLPRS